MNSLKRNEFLGLFKPYVLYSGLPVHIAFGQLVKGNQGNTVFHQKA